MKQCDQDFVARLRIATTAKHNGVAALDGKHGDVDGYVWSSLIDHADHTEWHADLSQLQSVWQGLAANHFADWVGERNDFEN